MRQVNDIIGQIYIVIFFFVMGATPLAILIFGTINFVRALSRRGTIVLQVLTSLVLWIFLTQAVVLIFMMMVFDATYPSSTSDDLKMTGWFILAGVIYTVAGAALHWIRTQAKLSRTPNASSQVTTIPPQSLNRF